jgi:hypothetical protein
MARGKWRCHIDILDARERADSRISTNAGDSPEKFIANYFAFNSLSPPLPCNTPSCGGY